MTIVNKESFKKIPDTDRDAELVPGSRHQDAVAVRLLSVWCAGAG